MSPRDAFAARFARCVKLFLVVKKIIIATTDYKGAFHRKSNIELTSWKMWDVSPLGGGAIFTFGVGTR